MPTNSPLVELRAPGLIRERAARGEDAWRMTRSSDAAIAAIHRLLPNRWVLNSISITEVDDYAVLLCPRGPVPIEDLGRVYGTGRTVCDALYDALEQLEAAHRRRPLGSRIVDGDRTDAVR